jgi:regulator of cell morphogenesis and NO signaling
MPTMVETVREIAVNQPSSIRVFESFGIDYCCGGRKPLALACTEQDVDVAAVLAALAAASNAPATGQHDWSRESLQDLSQHILVQHHEYLRRELPRLQTLAQKVVDRHGSHRLELPHIQSALHGLSQELLDHLAKEEMVLFPYIAQLEMARATGHPRPHSCFGTIENPIRMMMMEHDGAGEVLAELKQLSNHYTAPEDACPTYLAFYAGLKELEQDLHQHIHLENNILFPRAAELEASAAN